MNTRRFTNLPDNTIGISLFRHVRLFHHFRGKARVAAGNRTRYSITIVFGVALVLALAIGNPSVTGGANWPLAVAALGLLIGGVNAHAALSANLQASKRKARTLEQRLLAEASASRVLAGIKLLAPAGAPTDSPGPDSTLAAAARMATGYAAAAVFRLREAHGVFVPSGWSHEGLLAQPGNEFEPLDGRTPGAMAARQGSAVIMSSGKEGGTDLPRWAGQAGFTRGIVTPIERGLDTVGIVYVFNKSDVLPTLNEIEQLELIVGFASNFQGARKDAGNSWTTNGAEPGPKGQRFRVPGSRLEQQAYEKPGISMPGFALIPELERMELDGISLSLSPTEFSLVHTLASSPGRPVSPVELVNACWAGDSRPAENALDVAIFRLRRKLRKTVSGTGLIKTVRGSGYMFVPPAVDNPIAAGSPAAD